MTIDIRAFILPAAGCLMLLGAGCAAPSGPQSVNTTAQGTESAKADVLVTYRGVVIDAQTREPIPFAWIAAAHIGGTNPITNERGEFVAPIETKNVQPGADKNAFQLYAGARNYMISNPVTVPVADSAKPITLELTPETPPRGGGLVYPPVTFSPSADGLIHISGRILDAQSGLGLNDMVVVIFAGSGSDSSVHTDADGRFTMTVQTPGPFRLYLLRESPKYSQDAFAEYNTYYQINTRSEATANIEFKINQNEKTVY
jgi:hypothetical protein